MGSIDDFQLYWKGEFPRLRTMIDGAGKDQLSLRKKLTYLDHYITHTAYPSREIAMQHIQNLILDIIDSRK
jgi:hypothetical protein